MAVHELSDDARDGPNLLRAERTARGLSQEKLADAAQVSVRTIRDLERGTISAPRPGTIERVIGALGLKTEDRAGFREAWGLVTERRVVSAAEMIFDPRRGEEILIAVRRRMDLITTVYVKTVVTIGAVRLIVDEETERVLVADVSGVHGVPLVFVADSPQASAATTPRAISGCRLLDQATLNDGVTTIEEWDFGRRLDRGETHVYRLGREFTFHEPETVDPGYGNSAPWAGRCQLEGMHRGARLCVVEARFASSDLPRRCVYLLERQLDGGYEEIREVELTADGHAQIAVVDPVAGWHGLGWEW